MLNRFSLLIGFRFYAKFILELGKVLLGVCMGENSAFVEFRFRLVKDLLDYIILKYSREQSRVSGYELTGWVNRDYGVPVSPRTIYLKLYSLERQGLIRGVQQGRRREFTITKKGRETIDGILSEPVGEKFLCLRSRKRRKSRRSWIA